MCEANKNERTIIEVEGGSRRGLLDRDARWLQVIFEIQLFFYLILNLDIQYRTFPTYINSP